MKYIVMVPLIIEIEDAADAKDALQQAIELDWDDGDDPAVMIGHMTYCKADDAEPVSAYEFEVMGRLVGADEPVDHDPLHAANVPLTTR